jgi:uncharacterized protein (TIGR03437 family)
VNRSHWISRFLGIAAALLITATAAMAQNLLVLGQTSFTFSSTVGSTTVQQQQLYIGTSGPSVNYTTSVQQSGSWLAITPAAWSTPVTATITVNPTGLSQGTYTGYITVSAASTTNSPQIVSVTLNVTGSSTSTTLTVSSTTLSFSYVSGGTVPIAQSVAVTSTATQSFSATASTGWLSVTPASATTPATIYVSVNPVSLAAGTHNGTITLTPGGFLATPTVISVTLTVSTMPELKVGTLQPFNYQVGTAIPGPQTLAVTSSGAELTFTASVTAETGGSWLVLSSSSGATPADLTLSVSAGIVGGLPIGSYTNKITLYAPGASNPTTTITVRLNISTAAFVSVTPTSLTFSLSPGSALPAAKSLAVASTTSGINFIAATANNWLSVTPTNGTTPGTVSVGLTSAAQSLVSGTYTGTITVTTFGTDNPSLTVPVTLTVTTTPALVASPSALTFNYQVGYAIPAAQTVSITSSGIPESFTISTATSTGTGWLTASTTSSTTPATLTVSVLPTGLAVDTYSGTITLTPTVSGVAAITINVTLVVSNSSLLNVSPTTLSFTATTGSAITSQNVALTTTGSALQYTATAAVNSGVAGWLFVGPNSGTTPTNLTVYVNPTSMGVGTYTGTVTITATGANTQTVSVTLTITTATTLGVSSNALSFTQPQGASAAAAQPLTITASGTSTAVSFSATATTTSTSMCPANWFTLSATSGTTPATIQVVPMAVSYASGVVCTGVVTIQASGVSNSPLTVQVTLTVTANTGITAAVSPTSLSFTQVQGGAAAASQTLSVSASGTATAVAFTASAANTSTCGSWLTLGTTSGTTPATISVVPLAVSAAAGTTCTGTITIQVPTASNTPLTVPVTMTIVAQQTLTASPTSLSFTYQIGGTTPTPQTVQLTTSSPVGFTLTSNTQTGGSWLSAAASATSTPATITVSILTAPLTTAGTFTGNVIVASAAASNSPLTIPVTITVTPAAVVVPRITAVRNGASYVPGSVAPGEITYFEGANIGPPTLTTLKLNAQGRVDTTLAETRVLFDGIAAPLIWVWHDRLSCIVPYDVSGRVTVTVQVEYKGQLSSGMQFTVTDAAPGVFSVNQQGSGQGAILNQDYSVNGPLSANTKPASRGSVVMIYATGEGQTSPAGVDGKVNSSTPYPAPLLPVSVVIGGLDAEVLYAGAAPGFVSGALQINARVPAGVSPGDAVSVQVRVGTRSAQSGITMAVQ